MNKNRVERHGMTDKLAQDSKVQKGSKQSHVNAARVRGKLPHLIRGDLPMRAEVSRGHSSRWSNDHPGRMGKLIYRAKGQTDKELSGKVIDNVSSRYLDGMETRANVERRLKAGRKRARRKAFSTPGERNSSARSIVFVILARTAGCGPACPVVWEGGENPPIPIP